jgi:uncharacterized protein (DUF2267 family)
MSASGLEGIDHSVQQTHIWINEVDEKLAWGSKARAYRLLKAVLHAVRDHLQPNEAVDLGAQLPTFLRGVYYDQWRPAKTPIKDRHLDSFLATIDNSFKPDPIEDTAEAATTVFEVMTGKVTWGEIDEVRKGLPAAIRALWPEPQKRAVRQG